MNNLLAHMDARAAAAAAAAPAVAAAAPGIAAPRRRPFDAAEFCGIHDPHDDGGGGGGGEPKRRRRHKTPAKLGESILSPGQELSARAKRTTGKTGPTHHA